MRLSLLRHFLFCCLIGLAKIQGPLAGQTPTAWDVVHLHSGGQLVGTVHESQEGNQTIVRIDLSTGGQVRLTKDQIKQINRPSEQLGVYQQMMAAAEDTVDAHWTLSEWCRENLESRFRSGPNSLSPQRQYQLEQIIRLDPDHEMARALLGYSKLDGNWVNMEHLRMGHGMIRDRRRWITPGELAARNAQQTWKDQEKSWLRNLKKWRSANRGDTSSAMAEVAKINDPAAVGPLIEMIQDEKDLDWTLCYIEALGHIHSNAAVNALTDIAVLFNDRSVRERCLVQLKQEHVDRRAVAMRLHNYLQDRNNDLINRAGFLLGELGEPVSVLPLINALVTTHEQANPNAGAAGQIGASFGNGGLNGLQMGSSQPRVFRYSKENHAVLDSLARITGANYGFDIPSWMDWFRENHYLQTVDLRRDE